MSSEDSYMGECYINRLPTELLAAILEEHSVLELRAPFIDSQVCSWWHEATKHWPRVWSYITMRSITEHGVPFHQFKVILDRSGDSPLHVNLEYPYPSLLLGISSIMLFQSPTITRIQALLLKGWLPGHIRVMEGMPNLRILQLIRCYWGGTIVFQLGTKSFPLLDELVVHRLGSLPHVALGSPVLLRKISFYNIEHYKWVKILAACRGTLVDVFLSHCRLPPPARIHLPNLKFLALSDMGNFRNDIVAPGLITLHEYLERPAPPEFPFTFSSITEYACRVDSPSEVDETLLAEGVLPDLERFVLWGTWLRTREILRELVSHPDAVPKLKTIELAREDGGDLSDNEWAKLERLVVHTPLSAVLRRQISSRASYPFSPVCGSSVIGFISLYHH